MGLLTFLNKQGIILLDGAIGTELDKRGLMGRASNNLDNPDVVLEIQREYALCGCHALTTNTLTMNRIYIESHNIDVSVQDVNRAGVELARQAANKDQYILGDISSTGQLLEPYGTYKESQFYDTFKEQAEILAEAGVDGFIIETMFDLREALCALRACRDNFSLPVIVSTAFKTETKGGRTIMGDSACDCAKRLTDAAQMLSVPTAATLTLLKWLSLCLYLNRQRLCRLWHNPTQANQAWLATKQYLIWSQRLSLPVLPDA